MASVHTLDSLRALLRAGVRANLNLAKILDRMEIADVTDDEVDAVLDEG